MRVPIGDPERPGNEAYFGTDVNDGLVSGIERYVSERAPQYASGVRHPILLGCSPWFTDVEILRALDLLSFACVVLSKRPTDEAEQFVARKLRQRNTAGRGLPTRYFSEFSLMRPRGDDQPIVLSPAEAWAPADYIIPMFRTVGQRATRHGEKSIYAHAKLALLGTGAWTDEGPEGSIGDYFVFRADRLWISSANFSKNSRRLLEVGLWTEDRALIDGARQFLLKLVLASEDLNAVSDAPIPDFAEADVEVEEPDFDDIGD